MGKVKWWEVILPKKKQWWEVTPPKKEEPVLPLPTWKEVPVSEEAMEFPVTKEGLEYIKGVKAPPPPTYATAPVEEVLKYRRTEERMKEEQQEIFKKLQPERYKEFAPHLGMTIDPAGQQVLIEKGIMTPEEVEIFALPGTMIPIGGMQFVGKDMTTNLARQILKTKKGATEAQIKTAFNRAVHEPGLRERIIGIVKPSKYYTVGKELDLLREAEKILSAELKGQVLPKTPEITRLLTGKVEPTIKPTPPTALVAKPTPKLIPKGLVPKVVPPVVKPIPILPEIKLATPSQIKEAHILAKGKAMISEVGKVKPQYRRLAKAMTGKTSITKMTEVEAGKFINSLKKIAEPRYVKGKLVPPSIPVTKKITVKGFFEGMKFKEPTVIRYVTPQTYYSQILGVKPLVEPLELAKQRFDLTYRNMANGVEKMVKLTDKIGKTSLIEKARAKLRNVPTKAVSRMRDLLDKYEEAPVSLSPEDKEIFNWFRNLSKTTLKAENKVRVKLDLEPIKYRKAYVRHTADAMALEMLQGKYPFPQGLKYWSQRIVGKKIFNPMEFQRQLADDLEKLWTKDLSHATKSMLWTGLKEIHLSQPLQFFNEQLGAVSKDIAVYKNLTLEEREIYDQLRVIPASTKKWLIDYVNQVIKGQETWLDEQVNNVVAKTGLKGLLNKALAPFGRTIGRKPITNVFQLAGRGMIHGVMGPLRPRQLIRNKFQLVQNLGLYTIKANVKGFFPASVDKTLKELMDKSLFLKTYTGMEELPVNVLGKLEKLNLAGFQWTAKSNVSQAMKVAYYDTLDLITKPKYAKYGWADPARTYKEPKGFLYPSEKEKLLKEMEFGASATQYHYIAMGMPEVFRYKALTPATRLTSWWMNHLLKFNREAVMRLFKGETGYGVKLPWSRRLGWFRYIILGGAILNTLGYEKSYLYGTAPTGVPPTAQFMISSYIYLATLPDLGEDWAKRKNAEAKYQILNSIKTFIPGYLAYKDLNAFWTGDKSWDEYFFYKKKRKEEKKWFEEMPPKKK